MNRGYHVRMRPSDPHTPGSDGAWAVDVYDGRGQWRSTHFMLTKEGAAARARHLRGLIRSGEIGPLARKVSP